MLSYRLRPHHALCITFFEGKGYSKEFVDNMIHVIRGLEDKANVQLTHEADSICICCPNRDEQTCVTHEKVMRYDQAVLSICKLEEGQVLGWRELRELVMDRIIRKGKLQSVCGDCEWNVICQKG